MDDADEDELENWDRLRSKMLQFTPTTDRLTLPPAAQRPIYLRPQHPSQIPSISTRGKSS